MSKRLPAVALFVGALLMLAVLPMTVSAAPPEAGEWTKVVNAWLGLRMRSGPSLIDSIELVLYNGEDVEVKGDPVWNQGISWSKVRVERRDETFEGWVASAYLDNYSDHSESLGSLAGNDGYKVTSSIGLRLRSGPGLDHAVERIVPYGAVLEPTGAEREHHDGLWWRELYLNSESIWAADKFLEEVD